MLDDTRINQIVQQVMSELRSSQTPIGPAARSSSASIAVGSDGVFPDVDSAVAAAKQAFTDLNALPLESRP